LPETASALVLLSACKKRLTYNLVQATSQHRTTSFKQMSTSTTTLYIGTNVGSISTIASTAVVVPVEGADWARAAEAALLLLLLLLLLPVVEAWQSQVEVVEGPWWVVVEANQSAKAAAADCRKQDIRSDRYRDELGSPLVVLLLLHENLVVAGNMLHPVVALLEAPHHPVEAGQIPAEPTCVFYSWYRHKR
jgi:hypothetical protein